eukprot:TRINITY_DN3270_c0_g1_i1.p1 TRINITY_DN3270_c0_g1~~TRINITY_DN3270_c0_g1_i1.p1  ORF type:complete len:730 (-),score=170.61 TRINITY_DN3270_c0_g1_i1:73-2262(-)
METPSKDQESQASHHSQSTQSTQSTQSENVECRTIAAASSDVVGVSSTSADPSSSEAKETAQQQFTGLVERLYIDVLVTEAEMNVVVPVAESQASFFSFMKKVEPPSPSAYCKLELGVQEYVSSTIERDIHPVWNEDCTFTHDIPYVPASQVNKKTTTEANDDENDRAYQIIKISVWDRVPGLLSTYDVLRGEALVDLSTIKFDSITDCWLPCASPPTPVGSTAVNPYSVKMHLIIHKSKSMKSGMLAHYGKPLTAIPIRADVGDLFLMSSTMTWALAQKIATWSDWDHVGLAVRAKGKRGLRLLEATSEGVVIYNLNSALKTYRTHAKVGFRRLRQERTQNMLELFLSFVEDMKGKPYNSSLMQMWRAARGGLNTQNDMTSAFCSQLVAAAYQSVGVISIDDPANNFLPYDFAQTARGKLLRDLGKLIIFPMTGEQPNNQLSLKEWRKLSMKSVKTASIIGVSLSTQEKQKFIVYWINVIDAQNTQYIVPRRYSHFYRLDKQLRQMFPELPKLPPKIFDNLNENVVAERRIKLQEYLMAIVKNPQIAAADAFLEFVRTGKKSEDEKDNERQLETPKKQETEPATQQPMDAPEKTASLKKKKKKKSTIKPPVVEHREIEVLPLLCSEPTDHTKAGAVKTKQRRTKEKGDKGKQKGEGQIKEKKKKKKSDKSKEKKVKKVTTDKVETSDNKEHRLEADRVETGDNGSGQIASETQKDTTKQESDQEGEVA